MKTLLLFDAPPTHRPKLEVWKDRHGVQTMHSPGCDSPWLACAFDAFVKGFNVKPKECTDLFTLFAHWCRIIDEAGYEASADTEEAACYALAQKMRWPFLESVTEEQCRLPAHRPMPDVPELLEGVRL